MIPKEILFNLKYTNITKQVNVNTYNSRKFCRKLILKLETKFIDILDCWTTKQQNKIIQKSKERYKRLKAFIE